MNNAHIMIGDVRTALSSIPDGSVQTCITSPPYWGLRNYGNDGQLGLESTPDEYVANMVEVFREVRRVLADDGTLWLNLGDSYASGKQLVGIPWRVAFVLQSNGWYLRQDIIWHKPNPMPESVTDRCTKAHEYVFLLTKSARYYFDNDAIKEKAASKPHAPHNSADKHGGHLRKDFGTDRMQKVWAADGLRNRRSVWTVNTKPFRGAHFAVMPEALVEPCVLAGSKSGDTILDPFAGSGTVGVVALRHGRNFVGVELNTEYASLAESRIRDDNPMFNTVTIKGD